MNPTVVPDVDEGHERPLKETSEVNRKAVSDRTLPDQVADRTKRQVDKTEIPRAGDK